MFLPKTRTFGPVPVWDWLLSLPEIINWGIALAYGGLLVWLLTKPGDRRPALGILACALFWVLQDINRLSPYYYMYMAVIAIAAFGQTDKAGGLNALRIMVSGVYFWAGFHKANLTFFTSLMPWFINPIYALHPNPTLLDDLIWLGIYVTPPFEALIGILLLFPQCRRIASVMAFIMLVVVLICLGPFGSNSSQVVWPWNIWLFLMEVRLFWNPTFNRNAPFLLFDMEGLRTVSFILFFIAPINAIFTGWYAIPGFKLFSANAPNAEVRFPPDETLSRAPDYIRQLTRNDHILRYYSWAGKELNNPLFPVDYVFITSGKGLCPYLDHPERATLRIYSAPVFNSTHRDMKDMPLCPGISPYRSILH